MKSLIFQDVHVQMVMTRVRLMNNCWSPASTLGTTAFVIYPPQTAKVARCTAAPPGRELSKAEWSRGRGVGQVTEVRHCGSCQDT